MVYLIVTIALLCLAIKGYSGKKTSMYVKNSGDSIRFNLLRMVFCVFLGVIFVFAEGSKKFLSIDSGMFWICVLAGVSNAAFLVGWLLAIQKNSMVSVDVGLTLGSLIPAVLCACLFGESISLFKMFGFAMILVATVILAGGKKIEGGGVVGIFLLLFCVIGDGMSGFAQQLYRLYYTKTGTLSHGIYYPKSVYHFYTYVVAGIILLTVLICYHIMTAKKVRKAESKQKFSAPSLEVVVHIFVMAICLFAANYLQTVATNDYNMPSQVLYPIIKGGCLITVNFTAMIFFGEKITLRSILGTIVALSGIISTSIL